MKKILTLLFLLITLTAHSQNWQSVSFPLSSQYSISAGASIDNNNNIYNLEKNPGNNRYRLTKYIAGNPQPNTFTFPVGTTFKKETFNHIASANNSIFVAGKSNSNGIIYQIDNSLTVQTTLPINSTNGHVILNGISIRDNELFVVGNLTIDWPSTNSTISFGPQLAIPISQHTSFLAKYSLASNSWLFVKTIINSTSGSAEDVITDNSGFIYVTGKFKNSITLLNGLTPHTYSNTVEENYLVRFNPIGNFDDNWGLKQMTTSGNEHEAFDVQVDNTDVYYIGKSTIHRHSILGNVPSNWQKQITAQGFGGIVITQLALNNCKELYVSGLTFSRANRSVCGRTFFINAYNKTSNMQANWSSNSTASESHVSSLLIGSDDKLYITGSYGDVGSNNCSQPFTIDSNNSLTTNITRGQFAGIIDDADFNSCCPSPKAVASFVSPGQIVQMNSKYGPGDVAILCLSDDLLVDGSKSTCENSYFVGLSEFDLNSWTDVGNPSPLHSDWVSTTSGAPGNIRITDFLPQGYQLRPNIVYKFRLAVGTPWHSTDIFFMIDCC